MSIFVWSMIGIGIWHLTVFLPDRFAGGIIGAFLAAWFGALASGFVLSGLTLPEHNPPGLWHVVWSLPGALAALGWSWVAGTRRLNRREEPLGATASGA